MEPRILLAGEGGTAATGRRPVRELDTTLGPAGLQQRWLSRSMMYTQRDLVNYSRIIYFC